MNAVAPQAAEAPRITVTRGRASQAELAAVVAVLLAAWAAQAAQAAALADAAAAAGQPDLWADRSRTWFTLPHPGPGAWRASALPR